jgi:hypothetical protein
MADHRDWLNASALPAGDGAPKDATWASGVASAEAPDVVTDAIRNAPVNKSCSSTATLPMLSSWRLGSGWHAVESDGSDTRWRWTTGDAELLLEGSSSLDVVMTARYWIDSGDRRQRVA